MRKIAYFIANWFVMLLLWLAAFISLDMKHIHGIFSWQFLVTIIIAGIIWSLYDKLVIAEYKDDIGA